MNVGELYLKDMGIKAESNLGEILFEMTMNEGAEYIQKKYNLNLTTEEICTGINNRVYKFYEKEAMPKPKVIDFIEQAYENKIPMTIATSTDRPMIEAAFKRLHIDKYFKKIFTTTEVGHGKDKPDIFIKAMEEMETTPKQTWLFEDGAYSIETAKQLGIKTIGIYDPASEKDQEKIRNLTNIYIKNWTEHKTLLKQIQNNKQKQPKQKTKRKNYLTKNKQQGFLLFKQTIINPDKAINWGHHLISLYKTQANLKGTTCEPQKLKNLQAKHYIVKVLLSPAEENFENKQQADFGNFASIV